MPPVRDWVDPYGVRVKLIGGWWPARLRGYIFALGVPWTLFTERRNYDIAYFLMQGLHVLTGVAVAKLLGKRIVMKFSCSGQVVQMRSTWVGRLEVWLLRRWASSILILNPGMEEEAREVGFEQSRVGWMPNPIDTDEFSPCSHEQAAELRRELHIAPEQRVVVFVGRIDHQKKIPWLLGAFARVCRREPRALLALVGDGPLRGDMENLTRQLGIEANVRFVGRQSPRGVLQWLRASDAFTIISAVEGLPCALIEAMSAGVAPVVSDIPAHTQIVDHEVHGIVTRLGNEESIAEGLLRVLEDPVLCKRLGAAARERIVAQYSTPQVADCYERLFATVSGSR
jgi:glycosyltransferase involved in cell wall biosynthesis